MEKTLENGVTLNHRELFYIANALREIIKYETVEKEQAEGIWLYNMWLTPETCYHIANLLQLEDGEYKRWKEEINILRNGQNIK